MKYVKIKRKGKSQIFIFVFFFSDFGKYHMDRLETPLYIQFCSFQLKMIILRRNTHR